MVFKYRVLSTVFVVIGAKINIVKTSALRDIASKHSVTVSESPMTLLSGVSGNKVTVKVKINHPLKLKDIMLSITCLVVDSISFPSDILLGLYTMIDENIVLFPNRWNISIKDNVIPLCSMYRRDHEFNPQEDYVYFVDSRLASVGLSGPCHSNIPEKTGIQLKHRSCVVAQEVSMETFWTGRPNGLSLSCSPSGFHL